MQYPVNVATQTAYDAVLFAHVGAHIATLTAEVTRTAQVALTESWVDEDGTTPADEAAWAREALASFLAEFAAFPREAGRRLLHAQGWNTPAFVGTWELDTYFTEAVREAGAAAWEEDAYEAFLASLTAEAVAAGHLVPVALYDEGGPALVTSSALRRFFETAGAGVTAAVRGPIAA